MNSRIPTVEKHTVTFSKACRHFLSYALRIVAYGTVHTRTDDPHGEIFSSCHRLNYILSGNPFYYSDGSLIELSPGHLVYLPPNMTLMVDENKPAVDLLFINFEVGALDMLDDFREFMEGLFTYQHVYDQNKDLLAILNTIRQVGAQNQLAAGLEIQNLFESLFLHVIRLSERLKLSNDESIPCGGVDILNEAMNYINENLHRNFRLGEMADTLNISENYLYKIFVAETGKSPTAFITKLRMDTAKSALANPALPIKMIASHVGYPDVSHFSNTFKRVCGVSPREYRRQLLHQKGDCHSN